MQDPIFFAADAHEGPVWVADQCRLYFTTKTHLQTRRQVDILYLDFAPVSCQADNILWDGIDDTTPMKVRPKLFYHDINMANAMCLDRSGRNLIVCEQGTHDEPSVLSRINLADKSRSVIAEGYDGKPFNSLNKAIQSKAGHYIFSDPDYGFRQGFRPPPVLEPLIFVADGDGQILSAFRCGLQMPHGLALSPDERHLYITDTSNDGAHNDDVDLGRRKSVFRYDFDAASGHISGDGDLCFMVDEGVPDGAVTTEEYLLVGGGDGVYVANLHGTLQGKIPTRNRAVNVALAGKGKHLFVTIDEGVVLFKNWRDWI